MTGHQNVIETHQLQLDNDIHQTPRSLSGSPHIIEEKNNPPTYQFSLGPKEAKQLFSHIVSFIVFFVSSAIDNLLIKLNSLAKGAKKINFHFRLREFKMGPSIFSDLTDLLPRQNFGIPLTKSRMCGIYPK